MVSGTAFAYFKQRASVFGSFCARTQADDKIWMSQFHVFYTMPIFTEFASRIRTTLDNTSVSRRGKVQIKDCEQFLPLQDFFDANNKGVCAEEPRDWLRSLKATDLSIHGPGIPAPVYGAAGVKSPSNRDEAEKQIAASPALQSAIDRRAAAIARKNNPVDLSAEDDVRGGGNITPHTKRQRRQPPAERNERDKRDDKRDKRDGKRVSTGIFLDFWRRKSKSTTGSDYVQCAFIRLLRSEKCTKIDECEKYNKFTHGKKLLAKDIMSAGQVRGTIAAFIKEYGRLPDGPFSRIMPTHLPKDFQR